MKKALITGITGQDGSYLAEFLLEKGYEVHGIKRRSSSLNTERIDHIYQDPHLESANLILHYGDLTDSANLINLVNSIRPDEIYNLGAQSHVAVSFETPEYTANVDALGTLRILEAIKSSGLSEITKLYQASTLPMGLQSYTLTGLSRIIENPMVFMPAMEFYLIMNHREEGRLLLLEK